MINKKYIKSVEFKGNRVINSTDNIDEIINYHFSVHDENYNFDKGNDKHYFQWTSVENELGYLFIDLLPEAGFLTLNNDVYKKLETHFLNIKKGHFKDSQIRSAYHQLKYRARDLLNKKSFNERERKKRESLIQLKKIVQNCINAKQS